MIIIGLSPSAQTGTLMYFTRAATTQPVIKPPNIPPKKPAPMLYEITPLSKPGAIPGRSAIEYAIAAEMTGASNPIPHTPSVVRTDGRK